jgi:hypothetical protein
METIDDMEVQILLSKSDSFNSIYLKDVVSYEAEAETGRIFYSPPRRAPKKVFPASPRPEKSFPCLAPPRL